MRYNIDKFIKAFEEVMKDPKNDLSIKKISLGGYKVPTGRETFIIVGKGALKEINELIKKEALKIKL